MSIGFNVYWHQDRLYADGFVNTVACTFLIDTGSSGETRVCPSVVAGTACRQEVQHLVGMDRVDVRNCDQHMSQIFVGNISTLALITVDETLEYCMLTLDSLNQLLGDQWFIDFGSGVVESGGVPAHSYTTESPVKPLPLARRSDGAPMIRTTVDGVMKGLIIDTGSAHPLICFSKDGNGDTKDVVSSILLGGFTRTARQIFVKPVPGESAYGALGCAIFKNLRVYFSTDSLCIFPIL